MQTDAKIYTETL